MTKAKSLIGGVWVDRGLRMSVGESGGQVRVAFTYNDGRETVTFRCKPNALNRAIELLWTAMERAESVSVE